MTKRVRAMAVGFPQICPAGWASPPCVSVLDRPSQWGKQDAVVLPCGCWVRGVFWRLSGTEEEPYTWDTVWTPSIATCAIWRGEMLQLAFHHVGSGSGESDGSADAVRLIRPPRCPRSFREPDLAGDKV